MGVYLSGRRRFTGGPADPGRLPPLTAFRTRGGGLPALPGRGPGHESQLMHRLTETLNRKGVPYTLLPHPLTESALDEAIALGVPPREVIKSVLIDTGRRHAMAVLPATRRVDLQRVREELADRHASLATEAEVMRDMPQDHPSALPPIPSLAGMTVLVDPEVMFEPEVVCADASDASVLIRPGDLFGGEYVSVAPIALDRRVEGSRS